MCDLRHALTGDPAAVAGSALDASAFFALFQQPSCEG